MARSIHRVYHPKTGKYMGYRYVMYSKIDRKYVERSGTARTDRRFDAWVGTYEQGVNARIAFKIPDHYELILDGEEFCSDQ